MSLRKLYLQIFKPTRIAESRLVTFDEANEAINADPSWELAKSSDEEMDNNLTWIQKRVPVTE